MTVIKQHRETVYNRSVLRPLSGILALSFLAACGPGIHTKEKVQAAIINRLQTRSGLDVNALDVTTTAVNFQKNMAYATVSIHPKSDPSVESMVMKYTLENRSGKWVVTSVADSQGHGLAGHPAASGDQALPPGHPAVGDMQNAAPMPGGTRPKQ
jgi:hypothetical protein